MAIKKTDNQRTNLISVSQDLTGAYADIGSLAPGGPFINTMDCDSVTLYVKLDINDSTGVKIRMVSVNTEADTDLYLTVTKDISAGVVAVQPSEVTITNNADQLIKIPFAIGDQTPFVKFQIMATVVGATAGQLDACSVSFTSEV